MIFKFPKKKIVLDCFTCHEDVLKTSPIVPSMKLIPEWWKELPNFYVEDGGFFPLGTVKHCNGIVDYYKKSITIPLWTDLNIQVTGNNFRWQFADQKTSAQLHDLKKQATGFFPSHNHIKILSPWFLHTKENVFWSWSQPLYNFSEVDSDIKIPPAVINFNNQLQSNINILFPDCQDKLYTLKLNQPLVHLTPMFDNKIEIVRHLISETEAKRMSTTKQQVSFINHLNKRLDAEKKFSDCPFKNHLK